MSDAQSVSDSLPDGMPEAADGSSTSEAERKRKKKGRVRSAWISFVGRIVAQVLGATATIVLGLAILQRSQAPDPSASAPPPTIAETVATPPTPVRERGTAGQLSIAVLPLENFSRDPQEERFANAMTEALINALVQRDELRVISRTSSMYYRGLQKPLPEIGRELGVDLIVEGSIEKGADRIRLVIKLIDAVSDEHLWAETYDRSLRNLLSMQSEVAKTVARQMNDALRPRRGRIATPASSWLEPWDAEQ